MKALLEIGAELEIATPEEVRKIVRSELSARLPNLRKPRGTVQIPTPTALRVIDLGGPTTGRTWDVRHTVVMGADPTASVTGKALICAGSPIFGSDGLVVLDPFQVKTASSTLPFDQPWSRHQFYLTDTEHLFVILSGVTAGTTMAVHATVVDESEGYAGVSP